MYLKLFLAFAFLFQYGFTTLAKEEFTFYVPHIASTWNSFLLVDNLAKAPASFKVQLFDDDGVELRLQSLTIDSWEFEKFSWRDLDPSAGSAVITTGNEHLSFRVSFIQPSQKGTAEFQLPATNSSIISFNFGIYEPELLPLTWKGLALFNTSSFNSNVVLWALSRQGEILQRTIMPIAAHQRVRGTLDYFFEGISFGEVARVVAQADQGLVGLNISGVENIQLLFSLAFQGGTVPEPWPDGSPRFPFPQHVQYSGHLIQPNHVSQAQLDQAVITYYNQWKALFLKPSAKIQGGYLVQYQTPCTGAITVSEAHGYGMIITALMAGVEPEAQPVFDGMFAFYNHHRSKGNPELMDWEIDCAETPGGDDFSATDGDMDIAYALVLAHHQWGSNGEINYLSQAQRIITQGLKPSTINSGTFNIMLGDWDSDPYSTRSSDWMIGHCRLFGSITADGDFWDEVLSRLFANIQHIQNIHSADTGLIPDFIVGKTVDPAQTGFLEGPNDGNYYYNACRWPFRMVLDYAHYGDSRSYTAVHKLISWLREKTNQDVSVITSGYDLSGNALNTWVDGAFLAPFAAGAMVDPSHQLFLNSLWDQIETRHEDYYSDTLNLLCQILISGNWWNPEK